MKYQKVTIELLVESVDFEKSHDIVVEALRPLLKRYNSNSAVIDWRYAPNGEPEPHSGEGFGYADH